VRRDAAWIGSKIRETERNDAVRDCTWRCESERRAE